MVGTKPTGFAASLQARDICLLVLTTFMLSGITPDIQNGFLDFPDHYP